MEYQKKKYYVEVYCDGTEMNPIELDIDKKEQIFGRDSTNCDIHIDNTFISRKHCKIQFKYTTNKIFIQDLHSTHGTFINKKRAIPEQFVEIFPGDIFQLGTNYSFLLQVHDDGTTNENNKNEEDNVITNDDKVKAKISSLSLKEEKELFDTWIEILDDINEPQTQCPLIINTKENKKNLKELAYDIGKNDKQKKLIIQISKIKMQIQNNNEDYNKKNLYIQQIRQLMKQLFISFKDCVLRKLQLSISSDFSNIYQIYDEDISTTKDIDEIDEEEDDNENALYGVFSKKEGGNRRKLYHDSDDENEIFQDTTNLFHFTKRNKLDSNISVQKQAKSIVKSLKDTSNIQEINTLHEKLKNLLNNSNNIDTTTINEINKFCKQINNLQKQYEKDILIKKYKQTKDINFLKKVGEIVFDTTVPDNILDTIDSDNNDNNNSKSPQQLPTQPTKLTLQQRIQLQKRRGCTKSS